MVITSTFIMLVQHGCKYKSAKKDRKKIHTHAMFFKRHSHLLMLKAANQ